MLAEIWQTEEVEQPYFVQIASDRQNNLPASYRQHPEYPTEQTFEAGWNGGQ